MFSWTEDAFCLCTSVKSALYLNSFLLTSLNTILRNFYISADLLSHCMSLRKQICKGRDLPKLWNLSSHKGLLSAGSKKKQNTEEKL